MGIKHAMDNLPTNMSVEAKICGVNHPNAVDAAVSCGASYVGLVFYSRSPRAVTPAEARELGSLVPLDVKKVGLFVDPGDRLLESILKQVPLDLLQLHGDESPKRVAQISKLANLPIIKALKVANVEDLDIATKFEEVADMLLFDAKAPENMEVSLPGGNGIAFDWSLLRGRHWRLPWMLSGGLVANNVALAVCVSGARVVDVSSGVEIVPGTKDPQAIKAFLDVVKTL